VAGDAAVGHGSADSGAEATITGLPGKVRHRIRRGFATDVASAPEEPRRGAGRPGRRRSWQAAFRRPLRAGYGILLEPAGQVPGEVRGRWAAGPVLAVAVAAFAAAQFAIGRPVASVAWLAIAPLLGSVALRPLRTALLAAWTVLLGLVLALEASGPAGRLASSLAALALLAGFAVANSALRCAAQRRLSQPARWPGSRKALCCARFPGRWPEPG
jgi:hypothetical protein